LCKPQTAATQSVVPTHEDLEDTASLLVDEAGDTLDTATASETADSGLGDALNVVTKNLRRHVSTKNTRTMSECNNCSHEPHRTTDAVTPLWMPRSHSMVSSETYLAVTLSAALAEALATWTVSVWSSDV
jgi:hypothetical protein